MINLRSLIVETIDVLGADELSPEQYDQLEQMRVESGIRILSDKNLDLVYLIDGNVAGALWTAFVGGVFSFDTIVGRNYRHQGLGAKIIRQGLDMYREIADSDPEAKLELDVVNNLLVEPLKRLGLKVHNIVAGHTIMGYGEPQG